LIEYKSFIFYASIQPTAFVMIVEVV